MLRKDLAYAHMIFTVSAADVDAAPPAVLPDGYTVRGFQPGDEAHWARLEASVLEFEGEAAALDYYRRTFLPFGTEVLAQRCIFLVGPDGRPAATATVWHDSSEEVGEQSVLHWVCVSPEHQGKGLGRAVLLTALERFRTMEPGRDVFLHTQTWSPPAVALYRSAGFRLRRNAAVMDPEPKTPRRVLSSEPDKALEVLRGVLSPAVIASLESTIW